MEFMDVIKSRKSCREFSSRMIPKKLILDILEAGRLAPSAKNRQPWYFVILEGDKKNRVADILESDLKVRDILEVNKPTKEEIPVASLINSVRIIREAPVLILVFRTNEEEWKEADYISIGCALMNIHLAATNSNLGSIIIRDVIYKKTKIKKELGKMQMELVTGIVLGYGIEVNRNVKKKCLKEIVEWF